LVGKSDIGWGRGELAVEMADSAQHWVCMDKL